MEQVWEVTETILTVLAFGAICIVIVGALLFAGLLVRDILFPTNAPTRGTNQESQRPVHDHSLDSICPGER